MNRRHLLRGLVVSAIVPASLAAGSVEAQTKSRARPDPQAVPPSDSSKLDPAVLEKLQDITGLQASILSADDVGLRGDSVIKFWIPPTIDREKYVDGFVAARNAAGITKNDMPIVDSMDGFKQHDPKAFYVKASSITPDVLRKMENNQSHFSALLRSAVLPVYKGFAPGP